MAILSILILFLFVCGILILLQSSLNIVRFCSIIHVTLTDSEFSVKRRKKTEQHWDSCITELLNLFFFNSLPKLFSRNVYLSQCVEKCRRLLFEIVFFFCPSSSFMSPLVLSFVISSVFSWKQLLSSALMRLCILKCVLSTGCEMLANLCFLCRVPWQEPPNLASNASGQLL